MSDPSSPQRCAAAPPAAVAPGAGSAACEASGPGRDDAPEATQAALQALFARAPAAAGLPGLRDSVRCVQRVIRHERAAPQRTLSDEIVQDVALSSRLLRLVSVTFSRAAGGTDVDSLARATAALGVEGVARLAASLRLFDRVPAAMRGTQVQAQFARALLAALIAHALHPSAKEAETVYLAGLFQNLGRLLAWLHFPHEARAVQEQAAAQAQAEATSGPEAAPPHARLAELESQHAAQRFGLSYAQLGVEVARLWDWPQALLHMLQPMSLHELPHRPESVPERVRLVATLANHLADLITHARPGELVAALEGFQARWKHFLGEDPRPFQLLLGRVEQQWADLAGAMHLADAAAGGPPRGSRADRTATGAGSPESPWPVPAAAGVLHRLHRLPELQPGDAAALARQADAADGAPQAVRTELAQGAEQLAQWLDEGGGTAGALRLLADVLRRALGAQRVVVCLRDPVSGWLQGRLGSGAGLPQLLSRFKVEAGAPQDLFALACARQRDTFLDDAGKAAVWRGLPQWYRVHVNARCVLLLPLVGDKGCVGLVYADHPEPGGLPVHGQALRQVQALRDQVQAAFGRRTQPARVPPEPVQPDPA